MLPEHPFTWLSAHYYKRVFISFAIAAVFIMISLNIAGAPLITAAAPSGIVSFELAGDLAAAQAMVTSWGENGRIAAGINLGADYLFMPVYAIAIALGCVLVARQWESGVGKRIGYGLAWAQLAAALLDAIENYALIRVLFAATQTHWPPIAYWCALFKFILISFGLLYALAGGAWTRWGQR